MGMHAILVRACLELLACISRTRAIGLGYLRRKPLCLGAEVLCIALCLRATGAHTDEAAWLQLEMTRRLKDSTRAHMAQALQQLVLGQSEGAQAGQRRGEDVEVAGAAAGLLQCCWSPRTELRTPRPTPNTNHAIRAAWCREA